MTSSKPNYQSPKGPTFQYRGLGLQYMNLMENTNIKSVIDIKSLHLKT